MSTTVSGFTRQTNVYQPYNPGESVCKCWHCSESTKQRSCDDGDWRYGWNACCFGCKEQPKCSRLDPSVCPDIAGGAVTESWDSAPQVKCTYELDKFTTAEDIKGWTNNFGENATYTEDIMPFVCTQQSDKCPIDPMTGNPMERCSNMIAVDDTGSLCRQWEVKNPIPANAAKDSYCKDHNTPDCACINRSSNQVYRLIKGGDPSFPDACWYAPCANSSTYLVPSSMANPSCPSNTCQIVNNIVSNSGTDISEDKIREYTTCIIGSSGSLGSTSGITPVTPTPVPLTQPSFWDEWKWWILGIIIAVILLIFIIIIIYYSSSRPAPVVKPVTPSPVYASGPAVHVHHGTTSVSVSGATSPAPQ